MQRFEDLAKIKEQGLKGMGITCVCGDCKLGKFSLHEIRETVKYHCPNHTETMKCLRELLDKFYVVDAEYSSAQYKTLLAEVSKLVREAGF